jgi:hypothetical protein
MKLLLAVVTLLFLAACGSDAPPSSGAIVTVPEPLSYLVQSVNPDGNTATPLTSTAPWTYRRFDFGNYQALQSFLRGDGKSAVAVWSFAPFGPFVAANGDGGEVYELRGDAVYITKTQDGGKPGIQDFGKGWWAFDKYVPACSKGWRNSPDTYGRACRETITYPPGIVADTIVSEHYSLPGHTGAMERAFYALGWGRLAWMAFNQPNCVAVAPARAPALSALDEGVKCDERVNTNIVVSDGGLSGDKFGWESKP